MVLTFRCHESGVGSFQQIGKAYAVAYVQRRIYIVVSCLPMLRLFHHKLGAEDHVCD